MQDSGIAPAIFLCCTTYYFLNSERKMLKFLNKFAFFALFLYLCIVIEIRPTSRGKADGATLGSDPGGIAPRKTHFYIVL